MNEFNGNKTGKDIGLQNRLRYQKEVLDLNVERGEIPLNKFKRMGAKQAFDNDFFFDVSSYTSEEIVFDSKLESYKGFKLYFYFEDGVKMMKTENTENGNFNIVKCLKAPALTIHNAAMKKLKSIK